MEVLKNLGDTVRHGWHDLADNWRDLVDRGSSALTRFFPRQTADEAGSALAFPRWGMLAGEVIDQKNEIIVQLELPGVRKEDCKVSVVDGYLCVEGEKRTTHEHTGSSYRMMQRAYGAFRRTVQLPPEADADSAHAELRDGVLKVALKKKPGVAPQRHRVGIR
jgi:HSP20 family protein